MSFGSCLVLCAARLIAVHDDIPDIYEENVADSTIATQERKVVFVFFVILTSKFVMIVRILV